MFMKQTVSLGGLFTFGLFVWVNFELHMVLAAGLFYVYFNENEDFYCFDAKYINYGIGDNGRKVIIQNP